MITNGLSAFRNKRVLLLQGPIGPFFCRFAKDLEGTGATVFKINLNGGDWFFYRKKAINFRGTEAEWPHFLLDILTRLNIDTVMLFGDCRAYHQVAHKIARERGIEVGVFEEGYIRPNFVTLEREGVNGFSPLPDNPIFYLNTVEPRKIRPEKVGNTFRYTAWWVTYYYIAALLLQLWFPHYRHHRPLHALEAFRWLRSTGRKIFYRIKERGIEQQLVGPLSRKFFLVPLQVHNDAQIRVHSEFGTVEAFIRHVIHSFANHAPSDTILVVKHHPLDRAYCDYTQLLNSLGKEFGISKRLMYIHDQHLPSLLHETLGVVLVNSTVGFSALHHRAPMKVCGDAIYDIKGLTYQGDLASFWLEAPQFVVNMELLARFRSYVIETTQLNGSFYKRLPIPSSYSGIRWEERKTESASRGEVPAGTSVASPASGASGQRQSDESLTAAPQRSEMVG
jgi:capsular polysaccharide export protein